MLKIQVLLRYIGWLLGIYQLIRRNIPEDLNFQYSVTSFVLYGNNLMNLAEEFSVRILKYVSNRLLCFCLSIVVYSTTSVGWQYLVHFQDHYNSFAEVAL